MFICAEASQIGFNATIFAQFLRYNSEWRIFMETKVLNVSKAILISYILSAIALVVLAFIMYKSGLTKSQVEIGVKVIYFISAFIAGLVIALKEKRRRLFWGMAMGAVYMAIIIIISLIVNKGNVENIVEMLLNVAICVAGGGIGALILAIKK